MYENSIPELENSGTDVQLSKAVSHLQIKPSTEGNPTCQVCGEVITESQSVTIYLSRAAGRAGYRIGQCRCVDHNEDLTTLFTLGVRELVVDGRIGLCRDPATQETWPILLDPSVRLISAPDTKSGRVGRDHETTQPDSHRQGGNTDYLSNSPSATDSCQLSSSSLNRDGSSATVEVIPVERCEDG
jgi:hypothetical protein